MSTANPQPNFGPLNKQEAKATELTLALNFKCLLFDVVPNVVLTILTGSSLLTSGVADRMNQLNFMTDAELHDRS
uniref:Uncharacterized protein n=1 Tax=Romanomermis culicivorax TaxID=13658 RepID=A0A915ISZ8_ROMCU